MMLLVLRCAADAVSFIRTTTTDPAESCRDHQQDQLGVRLDNKTLIYLGSFYRQAESQRLYVLPPLRSLDG